MTKKITTTTNNNNLFAHIMDSYTSKPMVEWDTTEVALWLLCVVGPDNKSVRAALEGMTGDQLAALTLEQLTTTGDDRMGLDVVQAEHILQRIAFTHRASNVQEIAVAMDQLKQEKQALEDELAALKQHDEMVAEMDRLKLEVEALKQQHADETKTKEEAIQWEAQLRHEEPAPTLGKKHFQEDAYQQNRYF